MSGLRSADGPRGSLLPQEERQEPAVLDKARRRLFERGELELLGLMPHASNTTLLARCSLAGDEELVVYKPADGARPLYDFDVATLPAREVASWVVSQALGWSLVPATALRTEGPLGPGSVQAFIDHDPAHHYFTLAATRQDEFKRLALFDLLVNNADRKSGHCLLGADDRVWAIDNGLTFHPLTKIRTVIWDFAGEPIPAGARQDIAGLAPGMAAGSTGARLRELLAAEELDALQQRATTLAQARNFPSPRSDWSFPWPLV